MKTLTAIAAFIASWAVVNFFIAFAITLVFNANYTDVVTSGPFVTLISILASPIMAGYTADEVYTSLKNDQA
jgi:hypothetical protein